MSRKKRRVSVASEKDVVARAEWISARLREYGGGVHRLGEPAVLLDSALPPGVGAVYREFDGAELFHESVTLYPAVKIREQDERFKLGEYNGDDIFVDAVGAIWRLEDVTGELVPEGSRLDRWLAGVVDSESVMIKRDGEFQDDVFDEAGELLPDAAIECERLRLKRDPKAIGPRWRLARIYFGQDKFDKAREQLETVVQEMPSFPWAWFDLARVSESLGTLDNACDEAEAAADAQPGHEHSGFFLGHAARLARKAGLEDRAMELAERASRVDPELVRGLREGAKELLGGAEPQVSEARELLLIAKAVAPRDLEVLDLLRQLKD